MAFDVVIRSPHVITDIGDRPAAVCVSDGRIVKIAAFDEVLLSEKDITITGALIPGLVDSHVHINEPGRTQWRALNLQPRPLLRVA